MMVCRVKLFYFALAAWLLAACSSNYSGGISFEDFQFEVRRTAGPGAADCGHVLLGADRSDANCCVATNFVQSLPFSVTFDEQGIDSRVARGIARDVDGLTTVFFFDGDPAGGNRSDNGVINRQICGNPTLTENPCSDPVGFPLECQ